MKTKVKGSVRIDAYEVIVSAVESGVKYGINRAHKHTDKPSCEQIECEVTQAVLNSLCEVLVFDEIAT